MRRCLLALPLLLLTACPVDKPAQTSAHPAAARPSPAPAPAAAPADDPLAEGQKYYLRTCANCHGPDGSGAAMRAMLPDIGDLTSADTHAKYDDAALTTLIKEGRNKMPPMAQALTEDQIVKVIAYTRTLKK